MSKLGNRSARSPLGAEPTDGDDSRDAIAWSEGRGEYGDLFQRYIIKPFIAAYAQFVSEQPARRPLAARRRMRTLYSDLIAAVAREPEDPEQVLSDKAGPQLANLAVLDLGCGEAFLGRWLVQAGANYLGIDQDECLLKKAADKAEEAKLTVPVSKGDIVTAAQRELPVLEDATEPNLVTMTGVVDHIENFEEVMAALSQWASTDGQRPDFIIATLNPYFFRTLRDLDQSRADDGRPMRVPVYLAISDSNSWPYLRWPGEYERAFVDAGFHVLASLSPSVGMLQAVPGEDIAALCGRREAIVEPPVQGRFSSEVMEKVKSPVYVGPFILWLLRPRERGNLLDTEQLRAIGKNLSDPAAIEPLITELCSVGAAGLPVLELTDGSPVEHAGSLGGRCYVVLDGTVTRWKQLPTGDSATVQFFKTGELIGEFEAGTNLVADRFKDDITANGPCTLIVLEKPLLDKSLTKPDAALAARLFTTLRRRMSQYSWTWIPARTGNSSDLDISHVARAILFGLSHETQRPVLGPPMFSWMRDRLDPPVIVATPAELAQMIYGGPGGEKKLEKPLNLLVQESIIDYGIWSAKESERINTKWTKELAHDVWRALVYESFQAITGKTLPNHLADQLFRKRNIDDDKINYLASNKRGYWRLTQTANLFMANMVGIDAPDISNWLLRKWINSLAAVQAVLYCQSRSSMFIRDIAMLRELASCPYKTFVIRDGDLGEKGEAGMVPARWIEYAEVTISHVMRQLKDTGHFSSTAAAVGISSDIAASLMSAASLPRR